MGTLNYNSPPIVTITSDDSPYSTRAPSFTWESNEDATFKCAIDDTRFYQPCGQGLRGRHTARNVPDGKHAFFVQGTDKARNIGQHVRYIFSVDTNGPQGYLTSSVPRTTKNSRVHLTWQATEVATFKCTVDATTVDCGSGTRGEFTTDPLPDGKHTFTLDLVDKVGNKGEPVTVSWDTDSSSPVIQFDPNLPQKTSINPKMTWTSSEFAYFECLLDSVRKIICGQGPSGQLTFGVSKGPHTFSVRGTDKNGNVGEWKRHTFEVDADGPEVTFPPGQPSVTKSSPTFRWTSSEPANFKCGIDNSFNLVDCNNGSSGQWTGENIPDGQHVFIVIGTDKFGNWGPYAQHRFTVDNTVPVITFETLPVRTNGNPQIRWTSSENARFQCKLDGEDYQNCGSGFSGFWTRNNIPDGKHTLSVRGRDRNDNPGEPKTFEWSVDNQGPVLSITSSTPSESNSPRQRITWTSSEPATFECKINGRVVDCGSGNTGDYTTPNLPDGKHTFEVNAVDSLGNTGTPKVVEWTTDQRPPIISMTSRNPSKTSNPKYSFTWDTNEPADFQCKLNDRVVDCGNGTSGRYTTPNLPDGSHTFELTAVDNVGNRHRPRVFRWVTDTEAPVISLTSNTPSETNIPRQIITWDSNEPATFQCTLDGQSVNCGGGTSGIYTTPNLPDGKHTFTVKAVDGLGNTGTPKVVSWSTGMSYLSYLI
ncbi:Hypothetical predicted protein [Paramuricea clavata]|uniref:Uncharacterized protein n=1 Tax=Paramuricea clavata TaxID=317549 RepID=A0A7D9DF36_PARCT|nr:Hypothetical predicted protein [Paramuricea clavata]